MSKKGEEMNQLAKNREELVRMMQPAYNALQNGNLPPETRALVKGSIYSSLDQENIGNFELAKSHMQNLYQYGIK